MGQRTPPPFQPVTWNSADLRITFEHDLTRPTMATRPQLPRTEMARTIWNSCQTSCLVRGAHSHQTTKCGRVILLELRDAIHVGGKESILVLTDLFRNEWCNVRICRPQSTTWLCREDCGPPVLVVGLSCGSSHQPRAKHEDYKRQLKMTVRMIPNRSEMSCWTL